MLFKSLLPWLPDVIQTVENLLLRGWLEDDPSISHLTLLTSSLSSLYIFSSLYNFTWSTDISPLHLMNSALCTLNSILSASDDLKVSNTQLLSGAKDYVTLLSLETAIDCTSHRVSGCLGLVL